MLQATVVKAFPGRPDNETQVRTIEVGEVIEGELAAVAIKERWATKGIADPDAREPRRRGGRREEGDSEVVEE